MPLAVGPPVQRAEVLGHAITALRPGDHLILKAYSPRQQTLGTGGPAKADLMVEPEQLRVELEGLEQLVLSERQRLVKEDPDHQGTSAVVQAMGQKI